PGLFSAPRPGARVPGTDATTGTINKTPDITKSATKPQSSPGATGIYELEPAATTIGAMPAINDPQFLVIERNGVTATSTSGTPFKKIFIADLNGVASGGFAKKTELVDLMNI